MKDGFEKRVDRCANNFEIMMRHRVTDIKALDKRLSALETNEDVDQHASLAAQSLIHDRLTALEDSAKPFDGWFENLHKRVSSLECPSPLLLDLVKRVCELDAGSDYEVHEKKAPPYCNGCADYPCGKPTFDWLQDRPRAECYREKKTCGTCVRPFWNEAFGNGWCFAGKQLPVDRDDEACADFIEEIQ